MWRHVMPTGGQRFHVFGPGGRLIASRAVTRSGTFAFILGECLFSTVTIGTIGVRELYAAELFRAMARVPMQMAG